MGFRGERKASRITDDIFGTVTENSSWSAEIEEIHEEPTKIDWIDTYEREQVINTVRNVVGKGNKVAVEFGASADYMIGERKDCFPENN